MTSPCGRFFICYDGQFHSVSEVSPRGIVDSRGSSSVDGTCAPGRAIGQRVGLHVRAAAALGDRRTAGIPPRRIIGQCERRCERTAGMTRSGPTPAGGAESVGGKRGFHVLAEFRGRRGGRFISQAFHSMGETLTSESWMVPLRDLLLAALQSRESAVRLCSAQCLAFVCLCSDRAFGTDVFRQFEVPRFHVS